TVVLTKLHAGGKFGGDGYKVSGGLHGVGVSVVNALSEWLTAEVRRDGKVYRQEFARGEPTTEMTVVGKTTKSDTGTTVSFLPDADVFEEVELSAPTLTQRRRPHREGRRPRSEEHTSELQSLAYLVCRLLLEKK